MHVAITYYTLDQNEPSHPYVLELPDCETREQVEAALTAHVQSMNENIESDDLYDQTKIVRFEWGTYWADVQVVFEEGCYGDFMLVGLPDDLRPKIVG